MTEAQFTVVCHALRDGLIPPGEVAVAVRAMMDRVRELTGEVGRLRDESGGGSDPIRVGPLKS